MNPSGLQFLTFEIRNADNWFVAGNTLTFVGSAPPLIDISGNYVAGSAGAKTYIHEERDFVLAFTTSNRDNIQSSILAAIPYSTGAAVNLPGPTQASVGTTITITPTVTNVSGPVSYRWYKNGSLVGTGAILSDHIGLDASGTRRYILRAWDNDGTPGADTLDVYISGTSSGGGGGSSGGGCDPNLSVAQGPGAGESKPQSPGEKTVKPQFADQLPPCDP